MFRGIVCGFCSVMRGFCCIIAGLQSAAGLQAGTGLSRVVTGRAGVLRRSGSWGLRLYGCGDHNDFLDVDDADTVLKLLASRAVSSGNGRCRVDTDQRRLERRG